MVKNLKTISPKYDGSSIKTLKDLGSQFGEVIDWTTNNKMTTCDFVLKDEENGGARFVHVDRPSIFKEFGIDLTKLIEDDYLHGFDEVEEK